MFAVGGLQLYGLLLPGEDRLNFRDFPNSILTLFIMFTGDGWAYIMYKIKDSQGPGGGHRHLDFTMRETTRYSPQGVPTDLKSS